MIKRFFPRLFGSRPEEDRVLAHFPFQIVEASGNNAMATWEELKRAGRGTPVIVGDALQDILQTFDPEAYLEFALRPVEEILADADAIRFPEDLLRMRREEESDLSDEEKEELRPEEGDWPEEAPESSGLSVAYDISTRQPHACIHIVVVPTDDPTTIPAYLRWGGFNACPNPEYHVAALRHWRDRYSAELVGLDGATLNVRVARKPATREEALELARVQFDYCSDIVEQGVETISALGSSLMVHDWWYFWWD